MKKITPRQYAVSLYEALAEKPESEHPSVVAAFVKLIARNKDLSQAPKIIQAFREYSNEKENVMEVTVRSTETLDETVKSTITSQLKASFHKQIELHEEVDGSILGGAVLRFGDTIIDGSARKRLSLLEQSLKK